ncbi:MAG: RNA methyltransferase [Gemmataceae bacterium]|nr:RNA methyltransferase [Gemmataceae bacterium]
MTLSNCRVVLVRPHYAGNLGSVARAMRNFGLADLALVAPYCSPNDLDARRLATHGLPVLDAARTVPDLGEALADCTLALATSGLTAGIAKRGMTGTPAELMPRAVEAAAAGGRVGLVFGPEPHGLANDEIGRCHGLVHIPVDPEFSSLNLAQAVTICCYELRKAWSAAENAGRAIQLPAQSPPAPHAEQERAYEHLREALAAVGFLFGTRADALMHAVRQLVGRAGPTSQEVRLLHGLARQLLYVAGKRDHPGEPGRERPPAGGQGM